MSLINKMLKDLDARAGKAAVRTPVLGRSQRNAPRMVMNGLALAAIVGVIAVAGYAGFNYFKKPPVGPLKPSVALIQAATVPVRPQPAPTPAAASVPAKASVEATAAAGEAAADPAPERSEIAAADGDTVVERQDAAPEAPAERPAATPIRVASAKEGRTIGTGKAPPALASAREMSSQQKAESEYKRAGLALQEGRVSEAIAALERVLQTEPRHDAARQTLVSLLIEARRSEEAIRILQAGLVLEPKQPNMAMLLARLQIERGGPGVETLMRTLPYAAGNAEYHAFLAGALQREQRHREAIEQYQAALQSAPQNGIWLMGMGISMAAEKRAPEAQDAFKRAKSSGNLTPELASYVDRRLQQLGR